MLCHRSEVVAWWLCPMLLWGSNRWSFYFAFLLNGRVFLFDLPDDDQYILSMIHPLSNLFTFSIRFEKCSLNLIKRGTSGGTVVEFPCGSSWSPLQGVGWS